MLNAHLTFSPVRVFLCCVCLLRQEGLGPKGADVRACSSQTPRPKWCSTTRMEGLVRTDQGEVAPTHSSAPCSSILLSKHPGADAHAGSIALLSAGEGSVHVTFGSNFSEQRLVLVLAQMAWSRQGGGTCPGPSGSPHPRSHKALPGPDSLLQCSVSSLHRPAHPRLYLLMTRGHVPTIKRCYWHINAAGSSSNTRYPP